MGQRGRDRGECEAVEERWVGGREASPVPSARGSQAHGVFPRATTPADTPCVDRLP